MVAIQPENVRSAAAHLRSVAMIAGDVESGLRHAALLSELNTANELVACAEIDEELSLLARILVARAEEAEGFFLPGNNWRLTSSLLGSLLDGRGANAEMTGPLALHLLMTQGVSSADDGSNPTTTADPFDTLVFTVAGLAALAADPQTSPELAAAASFLAQNPTLVEVTRAWEGTGAILPSHGANEIPLRDIAAFLERNEILRQLVGPGGIVAPDDIYRDLTDAELLAAGIDPRAFGDLALPRDGHDLLVAAIHHGTFEHSPLVAREFIETLPLAYRDGQSIDIRSTDPAAIQRLHDAAMRDLSSSPDDFMTRGLVVAFLPETTTGIRNDWITSNYAEVAAWQDTLLNGSTPADDPASKGNNWFHLGTSASNSVGPVIRGEQQVFAAAFFPGFDTPAAVDQDVADGNQAIYHHFMSALDQHWQTGTTGSPRLDTAFALLDEAAATDDVAEAQHLVAESTVWFAIEEQIIVDPYLQLDGVGLTDHVGALLISTLGLNPRTAAEVMTDDGQLRTQTDEEELIPPIQIGEPIPAPTHENNYINPESLAAQLPPDFDWAQNEANNWTLLDQRIPVIEDVTILTLTEPALPAMVADRTRGNLDPPQPQR